MFIEIQQKAPLKNILVGVFYRVPGKNSITILTDHLKKFSPKLTSENKSVVLTSDMNINLLHIGTHNPTSYNYFLEIIIIIIIIIILITYIQMYKLGLTGMKPLWAY